MFTPFPELASEMMTIICMQVVPAQVKKACRTRPKAPGPLAAAGPLSAKTA